MGLETATYVNDLNIANPSGTDPKSQGDDHLRLLKTVLHNTFPGFAGIVQATATETGSGNAYVLTLSPAPASYTALANTLILFKATHANTGAATLNVNSLGAKSIVAADGSALESGDIESGGLVAVFYDGTSFCLASGNDRVARAGDTMTGVHDFTGATIQVPTQSVGDNSTKAASTAYVDSAFAPLASPALTGTPTGPTATVGTNTTQLATTAFVAATAFSSTLPAQTGNSGKFLTTNGSVASWTNISNGSTAQSTNYTLASTDRYKVVEMTSSATLSLLAAASAGDGFIFYVHNAGAGTWTIDPNASETVDGLTTIQVYPGEAFAVICDGSNWRTFGRTKRVCVGTFTVSGSVASLDIEAPFADTELKHFYFLLNDLTGSASGSFALRLKKSGAYATSFYSGVVSSDNGGSYVGAAWSASAQITPSSTSSTPTANGIVEVHNVANSVQPVIEGKVVDRTSVTVTIGCSGFLNSTTSAVQGARFFASGGNLSAGSVTLWAERY